MEYMVFIINDSIIYPGVSSLAYYRDIILFVSREVTISFEAVNNTLNFVNEFLFS